MNKQQTIQDVLEVKTLIPILKSSRVESTYALRLTPMEKYNIDNIKEFLNGFDDYVFSEEVSKKHKTHYHVVLFTKMNEDEVRDKIRQFLGKYFIEPPKRGDANKQYNLSEVENLELSLIYILKDGGKLFYSEGIDSEVLEQLKKKSYKKFSKEDFQAQFDELKKQFKEHDPSISDMMVQICQLKALYRQPINLNYIYQVCISLNIHNRPSRANEFVLEFLSRRI